MLALAFGIAYLPEEAEELILEEGMNFFIMVMVGLGEALLAVVGGVRENYPEKTRGFSTSEARISVSVGPDSRSFLGTS